MSSCPVLCKNGTCNVGQCVETECNEKARLKMKENREAAQGTLILTTEVVYEGQVLPSMQFFPDTSSGLEAARRGEILSQEEMEQRVSKWRTP